MSKPPFIISNRAGTELWPNTTQIPTTYRVVTRGEGLSAKEIDLANKIALQAVDRNAGRIKQFFLRQRMASDLGIVNFTSNGTKLTDGIYVQYRRNSTLEHLEVRANANAVLTNEELLKQTTYSRVWILIEPQWGEDTPDLDCLLRMSAPFKSDFVGWIAAKGSKQVPDGLPLASSDGINGKAKLIGETVAYFDADWAENGPERLIAATLSNPGVPVTEFVFELYLYWFFGSYAGDEPFPIDINLKTYRQEKTLNRTSTGWEENFPAIVDNYSYEDGATGTPPSVTVDPNWTEGAGVKVGNVQLALTIRVDALTGKMSFETGSEQFSLKDLKLPKPTIIPA